MSTKPAIDSFNKTDVRVPIPASQFENGSAEAEDILLQNDPTLDTDWGEIAPWDSADSNWHEP